MRRSKQQWLELIQAQQSSGVSIAEFCREHDLSLTPKLSGGVARSLRRTT